MSQSPEENEPGSDAPTKDEEQPKLPTFTLSIVSPSVEVASPLTFPQLLVTTTVQELKAKIREVVQSKPADSAQRLIHRGRMLERESQTMLEVFGQESVRICLYTQIIRLLTRYLSYHLWTLTLFISFFGLLLRKQPQQELQILTHKITPRIYPLLKYRPLHLSFVPSQPRKISTNSIVTSTMPRRRKDCSNYKGRRNVYSKNLKQALGLIDLRLDAFSVWETICQHRPQSLEIRTHLQMRTIPPLNN